MKTLEKGDGTTPEYGKLTSILKSCCNVDEAAEFEWDEDQNSGETRNSSK